MLLRLDASAVVRFIYVYTWFCFVVVIMFFFFFFGFFCFFYCFFFFNDTATTEIYTLSLHDVFRSRAMCLIASLEEESPDSIEQRAS